MNGMVYLVGAGPGDPDLITVKALRLIQQADVILYDRLIPHSLLHEARADAELIDVGKVPGAHKRDQRTINALIIDKARQGAMVVRLKGGDPFVFGRGGEEAIACAQASVRFEIVPGISSAIAVPAYAGIPVTHRDLTAMFTVFSGHEDPTKPGTHIDYPTLALAARHGTLVLLMGVMYLPDIVHNLIDAGVDPQMPAACIAQGTTADQQVVISALTDLPDRICAAGISAPATTVIGEVVRLRSDGLRWFADRAALPDCLPILNVSTFSLSESLPEPIKEMPSHE